MKEEVKEAIIEPDRDKEYFVKQQKNILLFSFLFTLIIAIIMLFFKSRRVLISGLVFGYVFSLLNYRLLYLNLKKALNLKSTRASIKVAINYFIRSILTFLIMYVGFVNDNISLLGTIFGLFTLKIVLYVYNIFYNKK